MALSSVIHLLPMLVWSTIHATNNNTSQIAITSTLTASLVPSIETLNMTVVFSALFTAMSILPSRNYILLVLELNALTLLLTCFWPIQSWTFQFPTLLPLPTPPLLLLCTLYSLITVPPLLSLFQIWHPLYLNLRLTLIPRTLNTLFSLRSFG